MRPDTWHIIAALKEIASSVNQLRKEIDELRDDVKAGGAGGLQFVIHNNNSDEDDDTESEVSSVQSTQSAPAAIE